MNNSNKKYHDQINHSIYNGKICFVGVFEKRITVYSQQVRSLNLIHSLSKINILKKESKVAIIGGGVAGLTISRACSHKGCQLIDLYEQGNQFIGIWKNSKQRWISPHIFHWPYEGWEIESTDLPFLNWVEGDAIDVANQILEQWYLGYDYYKESSNFNIFFGSNAIVLENGDVFVNNKTKNNYDLIFICVGYGFDGIANNYQTSYWADDNLDSIQKRSNKIFLSGAGDGAISDLLRLSISTYSKGYLKKLLNSDEFISISKRLIEIEDEAFSIQITKGEDKVSEFLENSYKSIETPEFNTYIILRNDTLVYFHTRSKNIYSLKSFPLNRFLLSRILNMQDNNIIHLCGKINNFNSLVTDASSGKKVIRLNESEIEVDKLIIRHGSKSPLSASGFNWIRDLKVEDKLRILNSLDQTGIHPIWDKEDFQEIKPLSIISQEHSIVKIAVAIVHNPKNNKYLIAKRKISEGKFVWGFISKRIRPSIFTKQEIELECLEETNISCNVKRLIGSRIHPITNKYISYYYCEYESGKAIVKDKNELSLVKWMKPKEIIELIGSQLYRPIFNIMDS